MTELELVLVCAAVGAAVGRWRALLLALPVAVAMASWLDFEGLSAWEVGVLTGIAAAVALFVGVAARRALTRLAARRRGAQA